MKATQVLMEEHRVIERGLGAIERAATAARQGKTLKPEFFLDATDFIKGFADGCHHVKEEKVLFNAMVKAGVPKEGGPIGAMLAEHEQGRAFVRSMRSGITKWQKGEDGGREAVLQAAEGYVTLLHAHIYKEENVLFPLADRAIALEDQNQVSDDFERVEHEETGAGVHEKYLELAAKLEKDSLDIA